MAAYMTITSRYPSCREFYLSKKKGTKGFLQEPLKLEDLVDRDASSTYANNPWEFMKVIEIVRDANFLLLPAGGNRVTLVHNCMNAIVDEKGHSVFGILGSRKSSPFKRINVGQAVLHQAAPRVTRSEERKEVLGPLSKNLAKCTNADKFRDLVAKPGEGGHSAAALWKFPQSLFVHHFVFESFGREGSMRAGDLAMKILKNLSSNTEGDTEVKEESGEPEKGAQLLPFLWSIENLRLSKVHLSEPPDNDRFDALAQKAMQKLDKEEISHGEKQKSSTAENPTPESPPTSASRSNRSPSPSYSPSDGSGNPQNDRIKSEKPSRDSPDGSPLAKCPDRGRKKGKKRKVEKKKKRRGDQSDSPESDPNRRFDSDSDSASSRERGRSSARRNKSPGSRSSRSKSRTRSRTTSRTRSRSRPDPDEDSDSSEQSQALKNKKATRPPKLRLRRP